MGCVVISIVCLCTLTMYGCVVYLHSMYTRSTKSPYMNTYIMSLFISVSSIICTDLLTSYHTAMDSSVLLWAGHMPCVNSATEVGLYLPG